jgi:hypothetical protein
MLRYSTSFFCRRCNQIRQFTKRRLNHRPHLIATVLTCGLWGIGWWLLLRQEQHRPWRCRICRGRQRSMNPPPTPDSSRERSDNLTSLPITPRRWTGGEMARATDS